MTDSDTTENEPHVPIYNKPRAPTPKAPDRLNAEEAARLHPVRSIRNLLRIADAVLLLGVLSAVILFSAGVYTMYVPGQYSWSGPEFRLTLATAIYFGSALNTLLAAFWLGYVAEGLATIVRLAAGPATTDPGEGSYDSEGLQAVEDGTTADS